jgi:5'-nucleotidase
MTELDIIHFNDVYNIEPGSCEPVGGAARFVHAINQHRTEDSMILFSGDVLSPSLLSTVTCGRQMTCVLKAIGVHCAVFGNHDFDFGVENAQEFAAECDFPWLISNCTLVDGGEPLAGGSRYHVMERKGVRVGIVGLIEEEWVDTLNTIDSDEVYVADFVNTATSMAADLRQNHGCHLVIALTHMRWPNDRRLASESTGIDLVLGGHDHNYGVEQVNGVHVIKSGTDFREFNIIKLRVPNEEGVRPEVISISSVQITSQIPEDEVIKAQVNEYFGTLDSKMQTVVGYADVPLDCRFR